MSPLRRQNPREEPGALAAHAGIRAGGRGEILVPTATELGVRMLQCTCASVALHMRDSQYGIYGTSVVVADYQNSIRSLAMCTAPEKCFFTASAHGA
jgi:hypothetical protein